MTDQTPVITTVNPDDPALAVQLEAKPPIVGTDYLDKPRHSEWTLDLLERTCFEFRAAGAWDGAQVKLEGYPSTVKCEVLAGRGADAMPWGWRPSQGPPPAMPAPAADPVVPDRNQGGFLRDVVAVLGHPLLQTVLLLLILGAVAFR